MDDGTREVSEVKDQFSVNMGHYSKIYMAARAAARKALGDGAPAEELTHMTECLYSQFCEDQQVMARETKKTNDMKEMIQPLMKALERRGLYV
jgi:hypothetical protein